MAVVVAVLIAGCTTSPQRDNSTAAGDRASSGSAGRHAHDAEMFETDPAPEQIRPPYGLAHDTVWPRIRSGASLLRHSHSAIDAELAWYRQNPAYLYRVSERARRYLHHVLVEVERRDMPSELALLPLVESGYNPFAYSRSGAAGLWQFMPITAKRFKLRKSWWYDGRKDVLRSTEAALDYLEYLHKKFDNDWLLAVAAYNFGEGNLQRAIDNNHRRGRLTDFWSLDLRQETRAYVPKLLALAKIVENPAKYGISLYPIPNRSHFAAVPFSGQIDLQEAAQRAGIVPEEIFRLNAGYSHATTDPNQQHSLLVPIESVDRFRRELAAGVAATAGISSRHYRVVRGDTLSALSRRFNVPLDVFMSTNGLATSDIVVGQSLLVPNSGVSTAHLAPQPGTQQVLHTIRSGEALWRIARHYGVTPQQILRWNGMGADEGLRAGERLSIWTRRGAATVADADQPAAGPRKVGYTVKRGDSLYGIATRFKVEIDDIVRWNGAARGRHLYPGQKLTLYVATTVALN